MKQFFRIFSLSLVVILTASSLTALAFKQQLLNPDVYINALNEAGVMRATQDIVQTKVTMAVETAAKQVIAEMSTRVTPETQVGTRVEPLVVYFLNSLIEQHTEPLVNQIGSRLNLLATLETLRDSGIRYSAGWLAGSQPDPEFFTYIPEPEQVETVRAQGVVPFIVGQLKQEWGLADLPPCTDRTAAANNLRLVTQGRVNEITCYSPEIRAALERGRQAVTPRIAQTQLALTLNDILVRYQVKTLADNLFDAVMNVAQYKRELLRFKAALAQVEEKAYSALGVSVLLLALGIALSENKRWKTFFLTYMWVGLVMVIASATYTVIGQQQVEAAIPEVFIRITDPAISAAQNARLASSLEQAVKTIVYDFATSAKFLGWSILLLASIGLWIVKLFENNQKQQFKTTKK